MRTMLLVMLTACGASDAVTAPDGGVPTSMCGVPPVAPVLDPATITDSHGEQFVILYPSHWDADVAFINASKAWSNCIVYGAH